MVKVNSITLRAGHVIEHENKVLMVLDHEIRQTQQNKGTIQLNLRNVRTGFKDALRFQTGEMIEKVRLDQSASQFLFATGDEYTFMDNETFEQVTISGDFIGEKAAFLEEGMKVQIESYEGEPLSIELPANVVVKIETTELVIKGQTASSSFKPAILENGLRVMVPPHVDAGTKIVVKTEDLSYIERYKE